MLPVLLAALAAVTLLLTAQGGAPLQLLAALLFAVSTLALAGWFWWTLSAADGRLLTGRRIAYQRHLDQIRRQARVFAAAQRSAELWHHPDPPALLSLIRTSRLWERRPADPDFAVLRLGLGDQPLAATLHPTAPAPAPPPMADRPPVDAISADALGRLLRVHRTVPALPMVVPLRSVARIRLEGDQSACRAMATAMVLQAAGWHAPTEFRIALCVDDDGLAAWDWLKWIPHLADPTVPPTDLPRFAVAGDLGVIEALLREELADRPWAGSADSDGTADSDGSEGAEPGHILVVVDGGGAGGRRLADAGGVAGVTVIDVRGTLDASATPRQLRLRVTVDDVLAVTVDDDGRERVDHLGTPDQVRPAEAAATARGLAATRLVIDGADHPLWSPTSLAEVIGVANPRALNTSALWRPRPDRDRLRVAIGVDLTGQAVDIDLKDATRGGMGPHGLVVGHPGSGKSELLRTIVLGLAITHPPDYLNVLLVDVPGRGTFDALRALPHTAAVVDGLITEPGMADRLGIALAGELHRRRQLFPVADTGTPVPDLLIVIDDCGDLLAAHPELRVLLAEIGGAGGALGLHLLLSITEPTVELLDALAPHLQYRIALHMASVALSRLVIGTGDAAALPRRPGVGYLSAGRDRLVRFTAASVSSPPRSPSSVTGPRGWAHPQAFRLAAAPLPADPAGMAAVGTVPAGGELRRRERALIDVAVAQLTGSGVPAHEIWLPPLDEPPTLDLLLPRGFVRETADGSAGLRTAATGAAFLQVPLGWVDRPFDQTRDLLTIDLSGAAGPLAIVGAPGSGRSTAVRSLICGLALTHSPRLVQVYCLDFGDGDLDTLLRLPHVGGVADHTSPERVRRTVGMLTATLRARENAGQRALLAPGERSSPAPDDDLPVELLLVVDGCDALLDTFAAVEAPLIELAARGRHHGIHLVLTTRGLPAPGALDELMGARIELRLDNPAQSRIDPVQAARIPVQRPGRGLSSSRLQILTALPRIDGKADTDALAVATEQLVDLVAARWPGESAPAVRVLPTVVRRADLPADLDPALGYPLGLDTDLEPILWDPRTDQHLLIFGGPESGKTSVLRGLIGQISARHGPAEARFILLDPRRRLLGTPQRASQVIATAGTANEAVSVARSAAVRLRARLPTPSMTWEDIASRHWWGSTADIYLVIDDYDQFKAAAPLAELIPLLGRSADIALHVIIARAALGGSRAMAEPVYATLADADAPALVLSGPASEGTIYGRTGMTDRPPGRGVWVPRRGPEVLMQALLEPQEW
jgi:S-DNA-T family DNA segregation ATPase FtsK/SpoIIIE